MAATHPPTTFGLPAPTPFPPLSLFEKDKTVSALLAKETHLAPKKAAARLFPKPWFYQRLYRRFFIKRDLTRGREWSAEELDQAAARGDFPKRPSDLFLKIYADVLTCLSRDPLAGNVSPALLGSSGCVPLSIVSTIPDIMKHYYDCIVLAQEEVFLVTNYWQPSNSVTAVSEALKELSNRVGKRKSNKVVVKIMWDRGAFEQLIKNHASVTPATWKTLNLPLPEEVPNLSLEVINFHRPLLGTFHQKAMVIDRKIALLNSNNIQDRPNIEMMIHLEGPIVDSIYDTLLLSWHEPFNPLLPCVGHRSLFTDPIEPYKYTFSDSNPFMAHIDIIKAAKAARKLLSFQNKQNEAMLEQAETPHRTWWRRGSHGDEFGGGTSSAGGSSHGGHGGGGGGFANLVSQLVEKTREERAKTGEPTASKAAEVKAMDSEEEKQGDAAESSVPSTLTEEKAIGSLSNGSPAPPAVSTPDLSSGNGVQPPAESPLGSPVLPANGRPRNDSEASEKARSRLAKLSERLNSGALSKAEATIEDESLVDEFKPHMLHRAHEPCPIAMVNRRPHGFPGHNDIRVAQDAAWLAGFRYAQKDVFIQTPTLNAYPIVRAIIAACTNGGPDKKGIKVVLWLGLGFNDKGESIPFQGGTNEEVVCRLFDALRKVKKEDNLHAYWYTGKDQNRPLNAVHKTRNCHVKFMSVDGQCAILGNGNQDTQYDPFAFATAAQWGEDLTNYSLPSRSWFHSQETNVLVDSPVLVEDWLRQLYQNQSTQEHGRIDTDGIWRDAKTKERLEAPKSVNCFTAIRAMI